uniref:C1q domain-containing protein n=1 Tax=Astatotilapia calliptera TaxID=8154 RepID=A0AAX7VNX0_ASTCA
SVMVNFAISCTLYLFCSCQPESIKGHRGGCYSHCCRCILGGHFLINLHNYTVNSFLLIPQFLSWSNTVIFSVGIGGNSPFGPFNTDVTMIYDHTFVNIGNAYSPVTGVFTAPVSGVYFFTIFSLSGGEHAIRLLFYKNNEVILHIHDHRSDDTADNGGNAAFLQLQQGDTVYVRLKEGTHVYKSRTGTTFSGFLVKQNS